MICNCLSVACAKRRMILSNIMYSSLFRACKSNPKSSIIIIVQLFDICKSCVNISLDLDISSALYMVTTESAKLGHVKYTKNKNALPCANRVRRMTISTRPMVRYRTASILYLFRPGKSSPGHFYAHF